MDILRGVRVIELAEAIAGPYCSKLFADLGADVVKIEAPSGDPFRARGSGARPGDDGALFKFLNAGKHSVVGAWDEPRVTELFGDADLVIDALGPGAVDHASLRERFPSLVIVSLSAFGLTGPYRDRPATEFTVQAESGTMTLRGRPDQPPLQAGGRVFDWLLGTYAAVAALAAVLQSRRGGGGTLIDCSLLETCNLAASGFAEMYYRMAGSPPLTLPARMVEVPSVEPTKDGWIGFNTNTRQQFESFLLMLGRLDLLEDDPSWAMATTRQERMAEWNEIVRAWTLEHTTAEIAELASELRIPVAQVNNGRTVLEHPHFRARGVWAEYPDGSFTHPLPPYRFDGVRPRPSGPAPKLDQGPDSLAPRSVNNARDVDSTALPLAGIRILDATAWWAGPSSAQVLAALGAEVIHLESVQHPDGGRMAAAIFFHLDTWWERSAMFLGSNMNKRGLTLDLGSEEGRRLLLQLVGTCDVLVENFSPRVFDNFGLTWEQMTAANERLIMVRMPAFGLDGPWRNNVGFAQTMEQMTGMAWVTGHESDQPRIPRGPCDPLAGMHSAFAMLAGLHRREETGRGSFIEVSMVESALNAAAELVVEYTAYGTELGRLGNRSRDAAPQGLYACSKEEDWLALSVTTDAQWRALQEVLGNPSWVADAALESADGRHAAHDLLDEHLAAWAAQRDAADAAEELLARGVPAAQLQDARTSSTHPQLAARGFFEELSHPIVGDHLVPALPFRFEGVERWFTEASPTLGQHNAEVLEALLGLDPEEVQRLTDECVIGTRPLGVE